MSEKPLNENFCDVCGAPATNGACDMVGKWDATERRYRYEAFGKVRYGCVRHEMKSNTIKEPKTKTVVETPLFSHDGTGVN